MQNLLNFAKLPRSSYYYQIKQRSDKYVKEKQEIQDIFNRSKGIYGYRRIEIELRRKGYTINHKTVLKLDNSQANRHKKEKMLKGISLPEGIPAGKILLFLVRS